MNSCNELTKNYPISRKDASSFLWLTDLSIRISRMNVFIFYFFSLSVQVGVLINATRVLSTKEFLFITLPNALNFWAILPHTYPAWNCFFSIFVLTCFFISKNLKGLCDFKYIYLLGKTELNQVVKLNLIRFNLRSFNKILVIFSHGQRTTNLTVVGFYSFFMCLGFTFPYLILFGSENLYFKIMYITAYINGISISMGCLSKANSLVDESVSLRL